MQKEWLNYFEIDGKSCQIEGDSLVFCDEAGQGIPIRNGIPRFTNDMSYSTGNFSRLRDEFASLQLDSRNGTTDRRDTILGRTGWSEEFFKGKTVLECGCGAGPDTEIMASFGANVLSADIAGLDVARANLGERSNVCLIQADIANLPLKEQSFDIVFCHRVIQHTPNPLKTMDQILKFVKPGGAVFVHSYSRDFHQMFRWKYLLRPLTKRLKPDFLFRIIKGASPLLYAITDVTNRNRITRRLTWIFVPFLNYSYKSKFAAKSKEYLLEFAIHDTFDALSPAYDEPLSESDMRRLGAKYGIKDFEIKTEAAITLFRTKETTTR